MERVAFLIERSGARVGALLNPESLIVRRTAGIEERSVPGGSLTAPRGADDPLLFTGGGSTELSLDLLFDVELAGSTVQTQDVRELTAPLWAMAENIDEENGRSRPPLVRFVWGKAWNIPGVVAEVAERLERFEAGGAPRRSWVRMRFLRVVEPPAGGNAVPPPDLDAAVSLPEDLDVPVHELTGGGELRGSGERLDEVANRYYGDPSWWRVLALVNDIADPNAVPAGTVLRVPSPAELEEA